MKKVAITITGDVRQCEATDILMWVNNLFLSNSSKTAISL